MSLPLNVKWQADSKNKKYYKVTAQSFQPVHNKFYYG